MTENRSTADEQAAAWWAGLDPHAVYWDRVAGMSETEIRMLGNIR